MADLRPSGFMECVPLGPLIFHADTLARVGVELVLVVHKGRRLIGVYGLSERFPLYTDLDAALSQAYCG